MNVNSLKDIVVREVQSLIDRDYWLCNVPHYGNVGDVAIWQGTLEATKGLPFRCIRQVSCWSPQQLRDLSGGLILFSGGGNFGDLWPGFQEHLKAVMRRNPSCRFVVLPQSAFWRDPARLGEDALFFADYDCTICARERMSFELLKEHFSNPICLMPDLAFACDLSREKASLRVEAGRTLFLRRNDCEEVDVKGVPPGAEIADWPTIGNDFLWHHVRERLGSTRWYPAQRTIYDAFANGVYRPYVLRRGLRLLAPYETIVSTRLHGAVLGLLLGKKVNLIDNAYGKNRAVYETWLKDEPLCSML